MSSTTEAVRRQYMDYPFPPPIAELSPSQVMEGDPSLYSPLLWPEGRPRSELSILSAGCGTVQAASLALHNPHCRIVGIDLSETSIAASAALKTRHALTNLELHQLSIDDIGTLNQQFDLIMCTGVLHHMPDPVAGLRALQSVLAPRGAMALMVYAKARRAGVYMLQDAFRRMGVTQDEQGIAFVRSVVEGLPQAHYFNWLRAIMGKDRIDDAVIVDTFLHPVDRAYSIPDVLSFVEAGGLQFQCWMDNSSYFPEGTLVPDTPLWQRIQSLPFAEQWAIVENLTLSHHKHAFVARHLGKADNVSFSGPGWLARRPVVAPAVSVVEKHSFNPDTNGKFRLRGSPFELSPPEAAVLASCNGTRTVQQLIDLPFLAGNAPEVRTKFVETFVQRNWKLGRIFLPVSVS